LKAKNANAVGNTRRGLARTKPSRRFARDAARRFGRSLGAERVAGRGREPNGNGSPISWMSSANAVGNTRLGSRGRNLFDGLFGVRRGASGGSWVLNVSQVAVENDHSSPISVDVERERCWKCAPVLAGTKPFRRPVRRAERRSGRC